ncbi:ATP-binding cassette domain-containing protein [Carboxydocella sp. ULO1]|uniref:ATP-binding cassette domain-containing protein n=1 Tax=Carboxydocella sp. ULO1 TaxID=1926599 RepID=UPI0009ABF9F7|nr:ATP-binding cassette domain-containing protein [Carboxydocella sp. ULO1]GAW29104.1 cobalt ABC transporter ATPase [Carboxydocella sp. ULO1]
MALIEVQDLFYRYKDGTVALRGLSLTIPRGKKVAILGPNGAGKSTLILHLNGIHLPQLGQVLFDGEPVTARNARLLRSKVGLVFQDPDDQVFSATVWEDVAFGPLNMGLEPDEISRRVAAALAAVGMTAYQDKAPYHLSYGQKKRVAIAGILAMDPEVIILDEPVAFLDPRGKDTLFHILDELNARGTTIVIATHDVDLAAEWADQLIVIKDGTCLAQGGPELLTDKQLVEAAALRFPIITRLFQQLPELQLEQMPKTIAEGAAIIRKLLQTK